MRFSLLILLSILLLIISCSRNDTIPKNIIHYVHTDTPPNIDDSLLVDGYFNQFSFKQEDSSQIFLNCKRPIKNAYIGIYDLNRRLVDYIKTDIVSQKIVNNSVYENGFGYKVSTQYIVPSNLKSGFYFLGNKCPFLVKNSSTKAKIAIVHPSNTDIAYNKNGGMSYYFPSHQIRARVLSKERPWTFHENGNSIDFYKWISSLAYNIDYLCDEDLENYDAIKDYKLLILAGHSEYWTRLARTNFDKFVDNNNNVLILSGNTMYWQSRIDSKLPSKQICYKYDAFVNDPINDILLKTGRWEDYRLNYNQINSIGLNYYTNGGFPHATLGFGGYKIIRPQNPLFNGLNFKYKDILKFNGEEYDGAKFITEKNANIANDTYPVYDNSVTKFYKVQLLAYDLATPDWGGNDFHTGGIIALKRKVTSGVIINVGASNWCMEIKKPTIQKITTNAIDILQKTDLTLDELFLK